MHLDQPLAGARWRREVGDRIDIRRKRRPQARNVEPGGDQIAFHMVKFGSIDCWIQLPDPILSMVTI
jgi:hypothetical protein